MCFSAAASFTAGVVLTGVGIYSLKIVKNPKYIPLASIPLAFGLQQLAEGGLWMSLMHAERAVYEKMFTYIFMFFSQVFWVTRVPLSIRLIETKPLHKKILTVLTILGIILSLYLAYRIIVNGGSAFIHQHHIVYEHRSPGSIMQLTVAVYLLTTIGSTLVSGWRKVRILGVGLLLTCLIAYAFYEYYFISVRCFFAALISVYIVYMMKSQGKKRIV